MEVRIMTLRERFKKEKGWYLIDKNGKKYASNNGLLCKRRKYYKAYSKWLEKQLEQPSETQDAEEYFINVGLLSKNGINLNNNEYDRSILLNHIQSYAKQEVDKALKQQSDVVKSLPSDEEVKEHIEKLPYYGTCTFEYNEGFESGTEWIKKQLKQLSDVVEQRKEIKPKQQICYKSNEPCKYDCSGLCKESY